MTAHLNELKELRNRNHVFTDRFEAGQVLADMLAPDFQGLENGMVLAIPSGGVPVGLEVSNSLGLPFDMILTRKLQIPGNTEAGFGAMTLDGELLLNREMLSSLHLSLEQIDNQAEKVMRELKARNELFRNNRPMPEVAEKAIILTDDGLASGFTMLAAVSSLQKGGAARIVVAVPTSPRSSIDRISPVVDAVYCANVRDYFPFAVANAYEYWHDLSREEVISLVKK